MIRGSRPQKKTKQKHNLYLHFSVSCDPWSAIQLFTRTLVLVLHRSNFYAAYMILQLLSDLGKYA